MSEGSQQYPVFYIVLTILINYSFTSCHLFFCIYLPISNMLSSFPVVAQVYKFLIILVCGPHCHCICLKKQGRNVMSIGKKAF